MPRTASSPATLSDQAYAKVQRMIINGELPPGTWLRKRTMATRLKMSATPVVEAFRRLQHEGMVQIEPQWGARVRVWTVPEVEQLAAMRIALETLVARRAAQSLNDERLMPLREMAQQADAHDRAFSDPEAAAKIPLGTPFRHDLVFHPAVARAAGLELIAREIGRLGVLQATCRTFVSPAIPTLVTHGQILDAIATGDPETAEQAIRDHIQSNVDHYMPLLREQFGEGEIVWDQPAMAESAPSAES